MMRIFTKSWWTVIIPIALGIIVMWVPEEVVAQNEGLVPCGGDGQDPCSLCHLFILIRNIFNFALQLLASIATLSIVIGGGMMVVSNGNPSLFKQGLTAVQNAIVGILLTLSFFVFFSFGLEALGFQQSNVVLEVEGNEQGFQFQPGQLFKVTCDTADYLNNSDRSWGGGGSSGGGNGGGRSNLDTGKLGISCISDSSISDETTAVLRTISFYEGTETEDGYYIIQGDDDGSSVNEFKDQDNPPDSYLFHPNEMRDLSDAFGKYQFLSSTWPEAAAGAGLTAIADKDDKDEKKYPMSPVNQDKVTKYHLSTYGIESCQDMKRSADNNGADEDDPNLKYNGICQWTSIPGCGTEPNGRTLEYSDVESLCLDLFQEEQDGKCD